LRAKSREERRRKEVFLELDLSARGERRGGDERDVGNVYAD